MMPGGVSAPGLGVMAGDDMAIGPLAKLGIGMSPVEYEPRTDRPHTAASDSASSLALEKRPSGSRVSALANQASKPGGTSGAICDGIGSGAVQSLTSRSPTASPSNGKTPMMQR